MVKNTVLFEIFGGQFVSIVSTAETASEAPTEDGMIIEKRPIIIQGFMLDVDSRFVYLGTTSDEINYAVALNKIVAIEFTDSVKEKNELQELLEVIPLNTDPEKMN